MGGESVGIPINPGLMVHYRLLRLLPRRSRRPVQNKSAERRLVVAVIAQEPGPSSARSATQDRSSAPGLKLDVQLKFGRRLTNRPLG